MIAFLIALIIVLVLAAIYAGAVLWLRDPLSNLRWNLEKLKGIPWHFGRDFLWGSATAAHQVEGNCFNNNWYRFESAVDEQGKPKILNGQKAGLACDHWNRYKDDIQLMKDISLNSYRFSMEWSKIEPRQGEFDQAALDHYEQVVDDLLSKGIEPMVTLHHFTNPLWFEDAGAFMQDDSPEIFTRFAERVVRQLGSKVKLWCTINEPAIYAIFGYFTGEFPPALNDARKAAVVYRNMLRAHTAAYNTIKKLKPEDKVGLVVHVALFEPLHGWNIMDVLVARLLNRNMNESHFEYLVKGRFSFSIPGLVNEKYQDPQPGAFDFVGLNYYTHYARIFKPLGKEQFVEVTTAPPERLTDMGYEIYPEGLYRCLKMISRYTPKPIYVTENGIADAADTRRAKYIEDHMLVLNKALADGIPVKGYFYWSMLDNFEWAFGFERRFGLYRVDFNTQKRTLYEGSRKLTEIIRQSSR